MSQRNFKLYQQYISEEFKAIQNSVRNIIGNSQWERKVGIKRLLTEECISCQGI